MKKILLVSLAVCLAFAGCTRDSINNAPDQGIEGTQQEEIGVKKGIVRVRLTRELGDSFEVEATTSGLRSGNDPLDNYLKSIGAHRMTRVFPYAGKYEARTRKSGLHLWYDIEFDDEVSTLRAAQDLKRLPGVSIVEKIYEPALPKTYNRVFNLRSQGAKAATAMPFNDPILPYQWHYNNDGTGQRSVKGADINVFDAWKIETGKPNVIVAVIDGGIDINHDDLKDNIHINEAELNGQEGIDDDNNGYVDDIYGYNFVDNNATITPHKHGTHVAGTVAARNNNGIGVAGVAGGNGSKDSGIRMISCQMFAHGKNPGDPDRGADGAPAIKYAADAGAVISQNSWGYNYPGPGFLSPSMTAAIDYFIEYAGCDEKGNQREDSPMKGGVVIFAAGNDYMDYPALPAAYDRVISVGSFGPDFKLADYSNRGVWLSVLAPGGNDWLGDGEVISTFPNNQYSYMVGTSMACPHVSGIAALVVSKFGKKGFTADELKSRLVNAVKDRDVNAENPSARGRMGRGYIDAARALMEKGNIAPEPVKEVKVTEEMTGLKIAFKTVADADDGKAVTYKIYGSKTPLTIENFQKAPYKREIYGHFTKVGDELSDALVNLDLNTKYYFAIQAEDRWGLTSSPFFFDGKTGANATPIIEWGDGESLIRVAEQEAITREVKVTEPDGQAWEFVVTGEKRGVTVNRGKNGLIVHLRAIAPIGIHRTTIKVIDIYGASAQTEMAFEVYKNNAPSSSVRVIDMPTLFVPVNTTPVLLQLSDYFVDAEGDPISFSVRPLTDTAGSTVKVENNTYLSVSTTEVGIGTFEITATDKLGASKRAQIKIMGVHNDVLYRVYPIPATRVLNVDLKVPTDHATVEIRNISGDVVMNRTIDSKDVPAGKYALTSTFDISKLAPGTYYLNVSVDGKKYSQPFVKQ